MCFIHVRRHDRLTLADVTASYLALWDLIPLVPVHHRYGLYSQLLHLVALKGAGTVMLSHKQAQYSGVLPSSHSLSSQ